MPPTEAVAPPAPSAANPPKSTTTVSTIAVRAGESATIVIALLQAHGYVHLRVDEMNPKLLSVGTNPEEASHLLAIHEEVMARLRSKEDQVHALLTRADSLGAEKSNPDEAIVYDAMAKSLHQAWRELNRQLILRGYMLKEALSFFRIVRHHEQLCTSVFDMLRRSMAGNRGAEIDEKIRLAVDETLSTTALGVEAGSSTIAQIRSLAALDDSPERPQESLSSCLIIENAMLKLSSDWENIETSWLNSKVGKKTELTDEIFVQIEEWLLLSEKKVKALNENGQRRLIDEGNAHKAKLLELGASGAADGARVAHLSGRIEEFVHFLKTRLGRSQRINAFYTSAGAMLSQLAMMRQDMENANEAMAGELVPLAKKKASGVIHEGRDISAKEVLTHEEQRLVRQKCDEMDARLVDLEEFAKTRKDVGVPQISQNLKEMEEWMEETVVTFLKTYGDVGSHKSEAEHFVEEHKKFVDQVVNRDATVASLLKQRSQMTPIEQEHLTAMERQYERAKDALEDRIQLGRTFEQVHRFAHDLESSFDALQSLLDTNRDFTNERVAAQMDNVFEMIKETLSQEKAQGERFISSAEQISKADGYLRVDNAIETVRNYITDHGHRFTYITDKWMDWQDQKAKVKKLAITVEEVEMWQEEAVEIIRLLQSTKITSQQDATSLNQRIREFKQTMDRQTEKLQDAGRYIQTKEEKDRIDLAITRQNIIEELIRELEQKITTTTEEFAQEEMLEKIHPPQILTELKESQVEEGSRFEFAARIEGEPEPAITWLKDGIDVKNNMDYRQDFVNGVASLVIEETFIEDTATYTVRAQNAGGAVQSSAHLTVKSRSPASSAILEEDKPKFALQLKNVATTEGETARMECVIVGRPEPVVTWYKEEETVREDERVRLHFAGDRCALEILETRPADSGLYTVKARNVLGETASFSQLKVSPKKVAPVPPPKPISRPASVLSRPPSIQPALVNSTWEEGSTATLQVYTQGEPRPVVQWKFNNVPIKESKDVHIEETADGWSRLIISPVRTEHSGLYTVVAENEAGETTTGASLHVSRTTTVTEDHLQQDMYEQINLRPVETVEQTTKRTDLDIRESSFTSSVGQEVSSVKSEKRWVDIIDEQLSRPSPVTSPIPVDTRTKTTVTEHRWVDEIDELMGRPVQRDEYEKKTAETYMRMVDELMSSTVPQADHEAAKTTQHMEYAQAIHKAPQPEMQRGTTTPSSKMFNIATVRMSPQLETRTATTTPGAVTEHAAISRQTPVPEPHTATITIAGSVENIAAIQQAPVPESHKATVTPGGPVASIAAIRQSPVPMTEQATITSAAPAIGNVATVRQTGIPETQRAATTEGIKIASIARVHTPGPEPERVQPVTDRTKVDRVDDVVLQAKPKHSDVSVAQKIEEEGFVTRGGFEVPVTTTTIKTVTEDDTDRRQQAQISKRQDSTVTVIENVGQQQFEQRYEAPKTRMIPITTTETTESGEGWVQDVREEMGRPIQTTTRVYTQVESQDKRGEKLIAIQPVSTTKTVTEDQYVQHTGSAEQVVSKIPIRREPVTTTSTSGEGWVKEIHEEAGKPIQTTMRQYTDEESARQQNIQIRPVPGETTVKQQAETVAQQTQQTISRIPQREPVTTTKTTSSAGGWVQEHREEAGKPVQTTFRQYIDAEAGRQHNVQILPVGAQSTIVSQQAETDVSTQKVSKIPMRREPVTTTITTTSGDGCVKEVCEEMGKPATTSIRQFKDEQDLRQEVLRRQVDENYAQSEISKGQRDSYLLASDAEGFWTDGAYTGSPTPPPTRTQFDRQDLLSLSQTATEPEFIRTFHNEYTVEEGGEITIECVLVGNPRPRVRVFFNDMPLRTDSDKCKLTTIHDTYMLTIKDARLDQAGYYKITAENKRGYTESLTVVHVRPQALGKQPSHIPVRMRPEHTTVSEEFAMYEYEQRKPPKHEAGEKFTPPPSKRLHETHTRDDEHLERYELEEHRANGHPPHFTQTLVSAVAAEGEVARFEGIVTGWPAPNVEWTKDGQKLEIGEIRGMQISNIGGRVALIFQSCGVEHSGKYMCTAKNSSGVATSSAQLVVRPKTIAPDFVQRLISEEVVEGQTLKWTVRVTGDPAPKVTWLRDGIEIPNCDEVRLVDEGNGVHSLVIVRVETADSGQFTCLAENLAGEARSTADLVVRPEGTAPGNYFHVTKVTQEKQVRGEEPVRNSAFAIETPRQSEML